MIDPKNRAEVDTAVKMSFALAAIDLTFATICAINGLSLFVPFMVLSGLMFAYGTWLKRRADETGE